MEIHEMIEQLRTVSDTVHVLINEHATRELSTETRAGILFAQGEIDENTRDEMIKQNRIVRIMFVVGGCHHVDVYHYDTNAALERACIIAGLWS